MLLCLGTNFAGMAELADALDSGSSEHYVHAGSSPVSRTSKKTLRNQGFLVCLFIFINNEFDSLGIRSPSIQKLKFNSSFARVLHPMKTK